MSENHTVLEGALKKKSPAMGKLLKKHWQSRHWRLTETNLSYYASAKDKEPKGKIELKWISKVSAPEGKNAGRFDIEIQADGQTKVFNLLAKNDAEAHNWVKFIDQCWKNVQLLASQGNMASTKKVDKTEKKQSWKTTAFKKLGVTQHSTVAHFGPVEEEVSDFQLLISKAEQFYGFGELFRAHNRVIPHSEYTVHVIGKKTPYLDKGTKLHEDMRTKLNHPFIFKQLYFGETLDTVWAMYYPPVDMQTSVLHYLENHRKFPEEVVRYLGSQLGCVIEYLHSLGCVFRNLTSERVWLTPDGHIMVKDPLLFLPLVDLPAAMFVQVYSAPGTEGVTGDWWRLGVFLYEIACGVPPFRQDPGVGLQQKDIENLKFPPWTHESFRDLVKRLLTPDTVKRLVWTQIQNHPWFNMDVQAWDAVSTNIFPPAWIIQNVVSNAHKKHIDPTPKAVHESILDVKIERLLLLAASSVDKQVQYELSFEGKEYKTEFLPLDKADEFQFIVKGDTSPSAELEIQVSEKTGDTLKRRRGIMRLRLTDLTNAYDCNVKGWQSVIDGSGCPDGELLVDVTWTDKLTPQYEHMSRNLDQDIRNYWSYELLTGEKKKFDTEDIYKFDELEDTTEIDTHALDHASASYSGDSKTQRFQRDGFDLNLSYITKNIIAMAFPMQMGPGVTNPLEEVRRRMQTAHAGKYRVYNLCAEKQYNHSLFPDASVVEFPFTDHNAPPFHVMLDFCQDAETFLAADPKNVIVVHSGTGRGRVGVMICAYLVYASINNTGQAALVNYARMRTNAGIGITIASQRRYVQYFADFLQDFSKIDKPFPFDRAKTLERVRITPVRFTPCPSGGAVGDCNPYFVCWGPSPHKEKLYDYRRAVKDKVPSFSEGSVVEIECISETDSAGSGVSLYGDVLFIFYNGAGRMFHFWINIAFLQDSTYLLLELNELDNVAPKSYADDFRVELLFSPFEG